MNRSKKYKITEITTEFEGHVLYRIEALATFYPDDGTEINYGDKGGWIEKESNLSQKGNCWVSGEAKVFGNAKVSDNAHIYGNACVYGNAKINGESIVCDNARIYGKAKVGYDEALASEWAKVGLQTGRCTPKVAGNAQVFENAIVTGDYPAITGNVKVHGHAIIDGMDDWIRGNTDIKGNAFMQGYCYIRGGEYTTGVYNDITSFVDKTAFNDLSNSERSVVLKIEKWASDNHKYSVDKNDYVHAIAFDREELYDKKDKGKAKRMFDELIKVAIKHGFPERETQVVAPLKPRPNGKDNKGKDDLEK